MKELDGQVANDHLARQVARLRRIDALMRWGGVALMWLTLGAWSCWEMRESIALLGEYFSFTGLQYIISFHMWSGGIGLIFCVAMTISSLVWQIGRWLWPPSDKEKNRLQVRVQRIQARGNKHLLWRWIQVR